MCLQGLSFSTHIKAGHSSASVIPKLRRQWPEIPGALCSDSLDESMSLVRSPVSKTKVGIDKNNIHPPHIPTHICTCIHACMHVPPTHTGTRKHCTLIVQHYYDSQRQQQPKCPSKDEYTNKCHLTTQCTIDIKCIMCQYITQDRQILKSLHDKGIR